MFYDFALTIPANTAATDPEEETIKLTHGVITHVEVEFQPGPAWQVSAYIRRGLHQVWPSNPDGKFRSDGRAIIWSDYEEMFGAPYELVIGGFSPDTTYDHELFFRFEVMPQEVAERMKMAGSLLGKVKLLLGLK